MAAICSFICDGFGEFRKSVEKDELFLKFIAQIEHASPKTREVELPSGKIRVAIRRLLNTKSFIAMSVLCVCLNIGFMLSDHADITASYQRILDIQNFVFFMELVVEVILGIFAYGIRSFFMVGSRFENFGIFSCFV